MIAFIGNGFVVPTTNLFYSLISKNGLLLNDFNSWLEFNN